MTDRLFSFYGDDFTGSTDALEAVASNGVPSVLFPDPPGDELLARFSDCRAIGIAGESRSRGPAWMDENLPTVFESLKRMGAPLCQYKVCSTFDSSPEFGSIGRAMEIGQTCLRESLGADNGRGASFETLRAVRESVRRGCRRGLPNRSSSRHEPPSRHPDARGGPAAASVAADEPPHRTVGYCGARKRSC